MASNLGSSRNDGSTPSISQPPIETRRPNTPRHRHPICQHSFHMGATIDKSGDIAKGRSAQGIRQDLS